MSHPEPTGTIEMAHRAEGAPDEALTRVIDPNVPPR
jgi:hypothetical protein